MNRGLLLGTLIATWSCGSTTDTSSSDYPIQDGTPRPVERDAGSHDAGKPSKADDDKDEPPVATKPGTTKPGNGEPEVCQAFEISTGRVVPDVLIVLDRSTSMKNRDVNRWDPSVSGLTSITAKLDKQIRFGLMSFPGGGGDGDGDGERCAAGELDVPIEIANSAPIAAKLLELELINSTPTASTLEAAHKVLDDIMPPPDQGAKGVPYVVLVTDGAPNCTDNNDIFGGGDDQAAVAASVAAIEAMAKDGIKTFVLGYDTASDPELKTALDAMAVAGATGDTEHHAIENEAGLIEAFSAIAGKTVSCDFQLSAAPPDPSYVLVKLADKPLTFGDPNGWTLSDDKLTLTLQGESCGALPRVEGARVSVAVQCEQVPVQ